MPRITAERYGVIDAQEGERLVLALERGGVDILHRCGGHARCTTCRVHFTEGEPERMTVAERDKLLEKGLLGEARLSCQIECRGEMVLRPLQTVQNTGLEPGKEPADHIEPEPVWVPVPAQG
ncbi:(2Fe-2S)-binding protein [Deinococcus metallilatus]|uniref:(2Fe-2S)-binding protein n=1 Tax=Deinococcus metallilatus TaxID=1211322 RepID=A0AAJ5F333_9DEIO|nr:2Fe-2S iron-sulfur cluster-binding protein [Deinococcus metallilatus]MBB5295581.1 ferredoxin [Deinococcus metallilatus]QBY07909.1 (2Fe-2S)-binding protein [Deinococcus metallilatus]RXJ12802.1 (2Fe-2S)-binding protein [Deinococcus metallilatus]TLK27276.1 (2Fe-2S)-binding protein [Deinococcus metallilatus]GMA16260.1 ferredoxin [Deinococcus metallilatus]